MINDCTCVDVVYQERLARIDTEVAEEEARQREEAAYKKQRIDVAEQRRNAPVDDSKMVDEMFGFVDQSSDLGGGYAPSAFKACDFLCLLLLLWDPIARMAFSLTAFGIFRRTLCCEMFLLSDYFVIKRT